MYPQGAVVVGKMSKASSRALLRLGFRSVFVPLAQSDPGIARESLYNHGQLHKLIVKPLRKSAISTAVIIDALYECKDEERSPAILSVLGQFVSEMT